MALRSGLPRLSCFSWPSLWVFRLKWNPMGCELKLKNILWKPNVLSSVRDQIKPNLPLSCSRSSKRAFHFWAPRGGQLHLAGSNGPFFSQGQQWIPTHSWSWPSPVPWESFCPGGSEELVTLTKWGFAGRLAEAWPGFPPTAGKQLLVLSKPLILSQLKSCCTLRVWARAWRC